MEVAIISLLGVLLIATGGWGYNIGKKIGKFNGKLDTTFNRLDGIEKRLNDLEYRIEHLITGKKGD